MLKLNQRVVSQTLIIAVLAVLMSMQAACQKNECDLMRKCCDAVIDLDQVGSSCGAMAKSVSDQQTCRTIVQTINYVLEDQNETIPPQCRLPTQ